MAGWDSLKDLVKEEIKQQKDEGCNVGGFDQLLAECGDDESKLTDLYEQVRTLQVADDFPFLEPNELEEIRRERADGPRKLPASMREDEWQDRFYGAWLGRSIGCALGKPLECGPFMAGSGGRPGWQNVMLWFQGADAWPIASYTPGQSTAKEQYQMDVPWEFGSKSLLENIRFMESDDDIRYTVMGLTMLETNGLDWDTYDVGKLWHSRLSYYQVATAETKAYFNFAHLSSYMKAARPDNWQELKHWVRTRGRFSLRGCRES